ncbi:sigma-54 interaction domain-containing protein [Oceanobacillus chungangensis]|uniref:Sigma-54-dependent Fis family transcriptional regulator n=1 Tax=Oceanobacillus chungangensis TaxID=1229152 RepID=A0A3D8PHF3_9BACI|nr:sigma 54-interacting transcriptional regulator [Oceanobacillus chungangensis]RDW15500.1 sigma-54-dependent Fis family transcriptional regulator [Oceanobacillus chungangensis]
MLRLNSPFRDEILETVLENLYYCLVIVDAEGIVIYLNDHYCNFLEVKREDAIGKHVADVIENSRMHIVARTGMDEIADLQYIRGNHMIANRVAVRANGNVVGAVGIVLFRDTKEWMNMNSHIKELLLELEDYRKQLDARYGTTYSLQDIIGNSSQITELKTKIKKIAPSDASVLIRGESGTGKELVAHSIHHLSERHTKPFVSINCASIPEHLIESELFGYKEGAFTGAKKGGKLGKFQLANGGTLFLDEIGDMPLNAQVKILRVLQEGEVEAIGAIETDKVDVRIIAATNQPLEKLIEEQQFREDLFYRINVIQMQTPPLRERPEDIRVLAKYILQKITNRTGKRVLDLDTKVLDYFMHYKWPGNIRELENVIESAVHLTNSENILLEDLPDHLQPNGLVNENAGTLKEIIEKTERLAIERTLIKANGDKQTAAKILGIGKSSLYDKISKYDL